MCITNVKSDKSNFLIFYKPWLCAKLVKNLNVYGEILLLAVQIRYGAT